MNSRNSIAPRQLSDFVRRFIGKRGKRFTTAELEAASYAEGFAPTSSVSTYLTYAVQAGVIERVNRGEYRTLRRADLRSSPSITGGHRYGR